MISVKFLSYRSNPSHTKCSFGRVKMGPHWAQLRPSRQKMAEDIEDEFQHTAQSPQHAMGRGCLVGFGWCRKRLGGFFAGSGRGRGEIDPGGSEHWRPDAGPPRETWLSPRNCLKGLFFPTEVLTRPGLRSPANFVPIDFSLSLSLYIYISLEIPIDTYSGPARVSFSYGVFLCYVLHCNQNSGSHLVAWIRKLLFLSSPCRFLKRIASSDSAYYNISSERRSIISYCKDFLSKILGVSDARQANHRRAAFRFQ